MSVDQDVQIVEDVPLHSMSAATGASVVETATDMSSIGNNVGHSAHLVNDQQPSTSTQRVRQRLLHFSVHFQDRIVQLEIADTGTVGELKMMLNAQTGVPPCQQLLSGWTRLPQSDNTTLSSLSLPRENILFLCLPNVADGVTAEDE